MSSSTPPAEIDKKVQKYMDRALHIIHFGWDESYLKPEIVVEVAKMIQREEQ